MVPNLTVMLNEQRDVYLKEKGMVKGDKRKKFSDVDTVANFLNECFDAKYQASENVWLLALDTRLHLIAVFEIASGGANTCIVDPNVIFRSALMTGATGIIVAHNHPTGITNPSGQDDEVTERLIKGGQILSCPLVDHIIIGADAYSYRSNKGYMFS